MATSYRRSRRIPLARWLLAILFSTLLAAMAFGILYERFRKTPATNGFNIPLPAGHRLFGIDISRYQGAIDWKQVGKRQDGKTTIHFAFIKATEGGGHVDPQFRRNWEAAAKQGIRRGAYHYFLPAVDPAAQARHFISRVQLHAGDLPPVLDVEETRGVPAATLRNRIARWLESVEKHYGVRPILYTYVDFYEQTLGDRFDAYPLWVAHYLQPHQPRIRRDWAFWQFSEKARISGIRGVVDLNAFQGDAAAFQRLLLR